MIARVYDPAMTQKLFDYHIKFITALQLPGTSAKNSCTALTLFQILFTSFQPMQSSSDQQINHKILFCYGFKRLYTRNYSLIYLIDGHMTYIAMTQPSLLKWRGLNGFKVRRVKSVGPWCVDRVVRRCHLSALATLRQEAQQ